MNDAELQKDLIDFIKEQEAKPYPHVLRDVIIREVLESIVIGEARVSGCATNHGTKKMYLEFSFYENEEAADALDYIDEELPGAGWISVRDRLPETRLVEDGGDSWKASGDVLCYGAGEIRIGYYEDDLDGRTWWNDREHGEGIPVTHWMELPAGPGEDDDNGGP